MQRSTKGYAHSPSRGPSPSRRRRSSSLTWGRSRGRWRTCTSRRSCTATSSRPTCSTASTRVDTYGLRTVRTYGLRVPASCVLRTEGSGQLALGEGGGGGATVRTRYTYQPRACLTHRVPWHPQAATAAYVWPISASCATTVRRSTYYGATYVLWLYSLWPRPLPPCAPTCACSAPVPLSCPCPITHQPYTPHPAPRTPRPAPRAPRNLTRACTPLPSSWPIAAQSPMRPRT